MCQISVLSCRYRYPIPTSTTGRGLDNDIRYQYAISEEIPSSCQEKEPFEAMTAKKKSDYEKLMVPFRKRLQYVPGSVGSHAGAQKRPDAVIVEGGNEHGGDAAGPNDVRPRSLV